MSVENILPGIGFVSETGTAQTIAPPAGFVSEASTSTQALTAPLFDGGQNFVSFKSQTIAGLNDLAPSALFTNAQAYFDHPIVSISNLDVALFTSAQTFFVPTIAGSASSLSAPLFTSGQTFFVPTLGGGGIILPTIQNILPGVGFVSEIGTKQTIAPYDGFVSETAGFGELMLVLFTNGQTFFGPTIQTATQNASTALFTNDASFLSPSLAFAALAVAKFTNAQTFFTSNITASLGVPKLTLTNIFFAPFISAGVGQLSASKFTNTAIFFRPTLFGGTISRTRQVLLQRPVTTPVVASGPTFITMSPSPVTVTYNVANNTTIGTLTADGVAPRTFTLIANTKFSITGNLLKRNVAGGSLVPGVAENVTIRITDANSNTFQTLFSIGVYTVPTGIGLSPSTLLVDTVAGGVVGQMTATAGVGPYTFTQSNTKFAVSGTNLVRSSTGTLTSGVNETTNITVTDANGASFGPVAFTITVIDSVPVGSNYDWHTPPAHPPNKINVRWIGSVDARVPPALVLSSAVEGAACWKVEVPPGQIPQLVAFNNGIHNTLGALLTAIGPTMQPFGGVEATIDDGYYRIQFLAISHKGTPTAPASNWCWQAQTPWANSPPFAGGVHLRGNTAATSPFNFSDESYSSVVTIKDICMAPFPTEVQWVGTGTVGAGATTSASFPTSALSNPPLLASAYVQPIDASQHTLYTLTFNGNVTTAAAKKAFTISGNTAGALPTITCSGTAIAIASGDTFTIHASTQYGGSGNGSQVNIDNCGIVVLDHVCVYRAAGNGLTVSTNAGWQLRTSGRVYEYDCYWACCGGTGSIHNRYVHSIGLYVTLRTFSHSSCGHEMKWECDRAISIDDSVYGHREGNVGWGNNNVPTNCTEANQIYVKDMRVQPTAMTGTTPKRTFITIDCRASSASAFFLGLPSYFKTQTDPTRGRGQPTQLTIEFVNAGTDTLGIVQPLSLAGSVNGTYGADYSAPFSINDVATILGRPGGNYFSYSLAAWVNTGDTFDLEFRYDDGTVYHGTFTIQAATSGTNPVYTTTISPPLTKPVTAGRLMALKKSTDAWDRPILDASCRDMHDPSSPTYLWSTGGILDASGNLDFYKQKKGSALYYWPAQYFDGVFMTPTVNTVSLSFLVEITRECYQGYTGNGGSLTYPFPPLKSSVGAWPDPPGAGEFDCRIHGSADSPPSPVLGKSGTASSPNQFTRPNATFFRNITWNTQGMNALSTQVRTNTAGLPPEIIGTPIHAWWLDNSGTVQPIADNSPGEAPMPIPVMFTATGPTAAGGNTVQVSSVAGLGNGMHISVGVDNQWGTDLGVHNATITNISGTTVTFSPSLPTGARTFKSISAGNKCAAIIAAGPKPPWWLDVDNDFLT